MKKTAFTKDNLTIETTVPREAARLRSEGFKEAKPATKQVAPKPSAGLSAAPAADGK